MKIPLILLMVLLVWPAQVIATSPESVTVYLKNVLDKGESKVPMHFSLKKENGFSIYGGFIQNFKVFQSFKNDKFIYFSADVTGRSLLPNTVSEMSQIFGRPKTESESNSTGTYHFWMWSYKEYSIQVRETGGGDFAVNCSTD